MKPTDITLEETPNAHPSFIQVYRAVNGWQTMLMIWQHSPNGHTDGFYDVQSTGMGPYGHEKEGYDQAVAEGKNWAEDEDVKFNDPPPFEPLKPGQPKDLIECLQQMAAKDGKTVTLFDMSQHEH